MNLRDSSKKQLRTIIVFSLVQFEKMFSYAKQQPDRIYYERKDPIYNRNKRKYNTQGHTQPEIGQVPMSTCQEHDRRLEQMQWHA